MRKKTGFLIVTLATVLAMGAAAKDTLAILPFTGVAKEEGETIAELFSFNTRLNSVFSPIPRTTIAQAARDRPDALADIGRQVGAKYVMAGNITNLGKSKLLVVSIISVDDLRQTAGDFQIYASIEAIREKLPLMAENLIAVTGKNAGSLPKLSVTPVRVLEGADKESADTLAQILAIQLIRSGNYRIYPQTSSLEQVQNEYKARGMTAKENIGQVNPDLVLSVAARKLGTITMFNAAIIDLISGAQVTGTSVDYKSVDEGIKAMEALAVAIAGERRAMPPVSALTVEESIEYDPVLESILAGDESFGGEIPGSEGAGGRAPEKPKNTRMSSNLKTGGLNVVGGLGSFLEKDWAGGLTVLGGYAVSGLLLLWELSLPTDPNDPSYQMRGVPGYCALGVFGASVIYGFIRPFIYNRNKTAAEVLDNVGVSVSPGGDGIEGLSLSYRFRY
jgi:hypothetical protein